MHNTKDAIRRHNNPFMWVMILVALWYCVPHITVTSGVKTEQVQ